MPTLFKMTDAGEVAYYLRIQIERTPYVIRLHQSGFAQQILNKSGVDPKYSKM